MKKISNTLNKIYFISIPLRSNLVGPPNHFYGELFNSYEISTKVSYSRNSPLKLEISYYLIFTQNISITFSPVR